MFDIRPNMNGIPVAKTNNIGIQFVSIDREEAVIHYEGETNFL